MQGLAAAGDYLRFAVTLTAVVDPFLAVPFFLHFTAGQRGGERLRLARHVAITVFVVLALAVFIGEALLELIGASLPAFRVGGGLVLLLMALAMLNAQAGGVRQSQETIATQIMILRHCYVSGHFRLLQDMKIAMMQMW